MAVIDSKKLLPAGQPGSSIVKSQTPFLVPAKNITFKRSAVISSNLLKPVDEKESTKSQSGNKIFEIKNKVISIKDVLKNTFFVRKKREERQRKEKERARAEAREKLLEKKKPGDKPEKNISSLSIPGGSIFDSISRFIGFTLAGYLFNKYYEFLPKLIEFGKIIGPVTGYILEFGKNILNGVVNFIDFGYKTYDNIREKIGDIGGENAQKTFDEFSKNLNLVLNGAIIAATVALSTSPGRMRGGKLNLKSGSAITKPNQRLQSYLGRDAQTKLIERRYGNDAARLYEARKSQGASIKRARADVLKRFNPLTEKYGVQRGLAGGTGKGSILSRGLGRAANRASLKLVGKVGTKIAKGVFARVPIVGGLLDFAFSLAMGEKPGRAAAKAVGSTVGAALGTFIPIPFAGTILGGILGDIVGGALYDTFATKEKPTAKAEGGRVSSRQSRVSPSRRIKTKKKTKVKRIQPQKTQPGRDVGGKKKIEELYGVDEPGQRSALRALKDSSSDVKRMKVLGGLPGAMFGAGIDLALGQKPDKKLSRDLGNIFGSVIQSAVDAEVNSSFLDVTRGLGMANGGVVPSREIKSNMSLGEKVGKRIATALAISIEGAASSVLNNLNRELRLEGGAPGSLPGLSGGAQYRLGGGAGGSQELREEVAKAAAELGVPAPDLLGVILAESGGDPSITNKWGCTGLIQFCPGTGQVTVGKTGAQLRRMSIKEQMLYVVKYLKAAGVKPGMSGYDLYSAIHAGHPGGNVVDAAGVSTRGYYNSRVKGLIETARANSQVITQSSTPGSLPSPESVSGSLKDTGVKDSAGRPVRLKGSAADAFIDMASDARKQGVNIGSGISNSFRTPEHNRMVDGASQSGHLYGLAFDINWYSAAGKWIRNNASRYGFRYNTYSSQSTHFDWVGGYAPKTQKPTETPTSVSKSTPKGESYLVNGKMYYADFKNNTIKDANGNIIDVSNGKNRWLLKAISEQRSSPYKPTLTPTLSGQLQSSLQHHPSYSQGGLGVIHDVNNIVMPILTG